MSTDDDVAWRKENRASGEERVSHEAAYLRSEEGWMSGERAGGFAGSARPANAGKRFEAQHDDGSQEGVSVERRISFAANCTTHARVCDSIGNFSRHLSSPTHGSDAHECSGQSLASCD